MSTTPSRAQAAERVALPAYKYHNENAPAYVQGAQSFIEGRAANEPQWLNTLRQQSLRILEDKGMPTPRLERWKYLNLAPLEQKIKLAGSKAEDASETRDLPEALSPLRAVFVDGRFMADLSSLPEGIEVCGSIDAFSGHDAVQTHWNNAPVDVQNDQMHWALCSLWAEDGFALVVPKNMVVEQPIEILYCGSNTPKSTCMRNVIVVEQGANVKLIEHFAGTQGDINLCTTTLVEDNARLDVRRIQDHESDAIILATTHLMQGRDSFYKNRSLSAGAEKINRYQIWVQIQGENAECDLGGAQLVTSGNLFETTILMEHEKPLCTSNQDYRHLAAGEGQAVFQGKVHVHKPAQKTMAYQLSRGMLLSERAEINTKPELEIYADDVRCSHGATTGQIDEDALFYMRARGMNEQDARRLLLRVFVNEVLELSLSDDEDNENSALETKMNALIDNWLSEVL